MRLHNNYCVICEIGNKLVEFEFEGINKYESTWKIKTSEEKFKVIPIAKYKA